MLKSNLIIALLLLFSFSLSAQNSTEENYPDPDYTRAVNNIELRIGLMTKFTSENSFGIRSVSVKSGTKGLLGAVSYTRWIRNNLALTVYSGMLNANADVLINNWTVTTQSASIISFLMGVKYEPFVKNTPEGPHFYITVMAGPVFGNATNVIVSTSVTTQDITETAFGSFIGAGVDIKISRLFMLGVRGGYNFVSKFRERVGFETDYSSPEISASFGVVF